MANDLRQLALDLGQVAAHVEDKLVPVVKRGALNIKEQMRKDAMGHPHFRRLPSSISFSMSDTPGKIEAEIGPRRGVLAGVAYFGTSRPGGATVPDPKGALEAEAPDVERRIKDIIERGFWQL
jgi:hypothetical protein